MSFIESVEAIKKVDELNKEIKEVSNLTRKLQLLTKFKGVKSGVITFYENGEHYKIEINGSFGYTLFNIYKHEDYKDCDKFLNMLWETLEFNSKNEIHH